MSHSKQLESLDRASLRRRAGCIRDKLGVSAPKSVPAHPEALIKWILEMQVKLGGMDGRQFSVADFGAPQQTDEELGAVPFLDASCRWVGKVRRLPEAAGWNEERKENIDIWSRPLSAASSVRSLALRPPTGARAATPAL